MLIDFWTYTCINCIRTLPYLKAWDAAYRKDGLTIVGVESPEFAFEKDASNVADAIGQFGLRYPVVQDNNMGTWNAYGNEYWPADYLIDAHGQVRYAAFGEGDYDKTETAIRALLAEAGYQVGGKSHPTGVIVPSEVATPETYLGTNRAEGWINGPESGLHDYGPPPTGDAGRSTTSPTAAPGTSPASPPKRSRNAGIDVEFEAKNVYLVLSSPGRTPAARAGAARRPSDPRRRRRRRRPRRRRHRAPPAPVLAGLAAARRTPPPLAALRQRGHRLRVHVRLGGFDENDWRNPPRLLREPSRPQRLVLIEIGAEASDLAVVKIENRAERRVYLNAACSSTTLDPTEQEHALAEIPILVSIQALHLPDDAELFEPRIDALVSAIDASIDCPADAREPLAIRSRECHQCLDIAPVEAVQRLPHDLHVLVRHRPLSIPQDEAARVRAGYVAGATPAL